MFAARILFTSHVSLGLLFAQNPSTPITVDVNANRHAINPNVYGVAYGDAATLADLNSPLNRQGGNPTTRYNWQINADNRAFDYYFESIGDPSGVAGERGDTFISASKSAGAQAMLTIPMIGWVAKLGANRNKLASFSIAKYGPQTGNDWQWFPDAGNGISQATNQNVTGNDPNDASALTDSTYQQQWVQHLTAKWGTAQNGGLRYYLLDNEPSIWFGTHFDVAPVGVAMAAMRDKIVDFAGKIRAVDASATILGPEEWGWSGYFYSGYDQQYGSRHNYSSWPDRIANGGWDYLPWLLSQLKQKTASTGVKYLDVFSVHYYPQGGEFGNDTSAATQLLRNRSTRSLWDPNYVDESWINDKVQLIPRLKNWVSAYYFPGTPVALTEYNWGAESYIGGATAQADILGIFGREGLDMAARWTTPDPSTPTYKAIKLYRNYDGAKSSFGETSVLANAPNPDNVAAFAAQRSSDGALTVMVVNKYLTGNTPVTVNVGNFSGAGSAQAWQLTAANAIARIADVPFGGGALSATLPPLSATLFVLPALVQAPPTVVSVSPINGGGTTQTFTAVYSDGLGATDLRGTYLLFNSTLNGLGACWIFYNRAANTLNLVNDAGTATLPPTVTPGGSGTVSNSQCTVASGGAAVASGNTLTVPVAVAFSGGFAGPKTVFGYASGGSAATGWQTLGTWTPSAAPLPVVVSLSPNNGSGAARTFTAVYSDALGAADIGVTYLLFNSALNGAGACFLAYNHAANSWILVNDTGTGFAPGSVTPGGGGTASNGQCTIGSGGPVVASGNTLSIPVAIAFTSGFTGQKSVYGFAAGSAASGWQTMGSWTPNPAVVPVVVSVTPVNGVGASQTFTAVYSDALGRADLSATYLLFNASVNGAGACFVAYYRAANTLSLVNDAGSGLVPGTVTPGGAGTLTNGQCTIGSGGAVAASGNNLSVPVAITFASGYVGSKNVFGYAVANNGAVSVWQPLGAWTP